MGAFIVGLKWAAEYLPDKIADDSQWTLLIHDEVAETWLTASAFIRDFCFMEGAGVL